MLQSDEAQHDEVACCAAAARENIFTFVQQEVRFPLDGLRAVDRITSMLLLQALNYSINKWS